jgi:hypothetical protein
MLCSQFSFRIFNLNNFRFLNGTLCILSRQIDCLIFFLEIINKIGIHICVFGRQ